MHPSVFPRLQTFPHSQFDSTEHVHSAVQHNRYLVVCPSLLLTVESKRARVSGRLMILCTGNPACVSRGCLSRGSRFPSRLVIYEFTPRARMIQMGCLRETEEPGGWTLCQVSREKVSTRIRSMYVWMKWKPRDTEGSHWFP